MSKQFSKKSWADLAYEQSDSDSDLEDNTLTILKTQSQTVVLQSTLPTMQKSISQINNLPRYFQRVLKAVQEENGSIVEVAVRDCPKGVTQQNLKDVLPILSCTITEELVTFLIKKEDIIDHIHRKQLQQIILNEMCTLCIQKPTEESRAVVEEIKIKDLKKVAPQKYIVKEDRQRKAERQYQTKYQSKKQDD